MAIKQAFRRGSRSAKETGELPFRDLYTRVLMNIQGERPAVLGVSSAIDGEGKTTIASGIAVTLAKDGALFKSGRQPGDILLVECNRALRPAEGEVTAPAVPGLVDYLQRRCALGDAIRWMGYDHLAFMPLGAAVDDFPLLIRGAAMPSMLQDLRERFDLIVVDLPSVLTTTDTRVLAGMTDGILLVVRAGATPARLVGRALEELEGIPLVGVVLNDSRRELPGWLEQRL